MIILFIVNSPDFFLSHRLPLALAARECGFHVHIATGPGRSSQKIVDLNFQYHELPISRSGRKPLAELRAVFAIYALMKCIRPNLVHLVSIKPVLYGGLIARLLSVPAMVAAVSGLGTVFLGASRSRKVLRFFVKRFYRLSLSHSNSRVIFQNFDDFQSLISIGAVSAQNAFLIKGSGVSLSNYHVVPEPTDVPVVTFASRLLIDKGVIEFCDAARELRKRGVDARFLLAGSRDKDSLSSVSLKFISDLQQEGVIELLGYQNDIARLFSSSNLVVLPSYREGFPKVLMEAAACGRAVVTTDVPGCRDAVKHGETGLVVAAFDHLALADAIEKLVLDRELRAKMGTNARCLAESDFSIESVIQAHLSIYRGLVQ